MEIYTVEVIFIRSQLMYKVFCKAYLGYKASYETSFVLSLAFPQPDDILFFFIRTSKF